MYVLRRHIAALTVLAAAALFFVSSRASAWVETRVLSHRAVVDVERNGSAVVAHELAIRLRGGPLVALPVAGIDSDAEPLTDATVICTDDAKFGVVPLRVQLRPDGTLELGVDRERGLRSGSYVFRFSYRTQLLARDLIRRVGSGLELRWVGPRFEDGLDSARVTFRIPEATVAPNLPDVTQGGGLVKETDELGGVFVANLRRTPGKDELEVVRPHVARGEPVLWRVRVSDRAFDAFAKAVAPKLSFAALPRELAGPVRERLAWLAAAFAGGAALAFLLWQKWRTFERSCRERRAEGRSLLPIDRPALRISCASVSFGLAIIAGGHWDEPTWAAVLLTVAMLGSVLYVRPVRAEPRGPGRWLPLSDAEAFAVPKRERAGRYLDAGRRHGALLLAALGVGAGAAYVQVARTSNYRALETLLLCAIVLPVFCSGRAAELPESAARAGRGKLFRLAARLRKRGLKVVALARLPLGTAEADELRLAVVPRATISGFVALEVGVERTWGLGGSWDEPYLLVRAREDSACHRTLLRELGFQRGRKPDERVAIVKPRLPTVALTEALVYELARRLTVQGSSNAASSGGKAASARKPPRTSSPAHAM